MVVLPRKAAVFAAFLLMSASFHSSAGLANEEQLWNVDEAELTCAGLTAARGRLNTFELFLGAKICMSEESVVDATTFLILGQLRYFTEFKLCTPVTPEGEPLYQGLALMVYGEWGGSGPESVYVDPVSRDLILNTAATWSPEAPPDSQIAWSCAVDHDVETYRDTLISNRETRVKQLVEYTLPLGDVDYQAPQREADEILARNSTSSTAHRTMQPVTSSCVGSRLKSRSATSKR